MRICPKCGKENSNNAVHCGKCGAVLIKKENGKSNSKGVIAAGIGGFAAVLLIGGLFLFKGNNSAGKKDTETAENGTSQTESEIIDSQAQAENSETVSTAEQTTDTNNDTQERTKWEDAVLEEAMRKITGNSSDDFSPEDVTDLTTLDLCKTDQFERA